MDTDHDMFITENMADGDRPYFVEKAKRTIHKETEQLNTSLLTACQKLKAIAGQPPPIDYENKLQAIYLRTSTRLEAQVALIWWNLVIEATNLEFEEKVVLLEVLYNFYTLQRIAKPFDRYPSVEEIRTSQVSRDIVDQISHWNNHHREVILDKLRIESQMRIMLIYHKRYRFRRWGFW